MPSISSFPIKLGDTSIIIEHTITGDGHTFFHLHQDEQTALQAAKEVIASEGGSLLTLSHSGARNIIFHLNDKKYEFDPNRIFTNNGIKKTLEEFGSYTEEAHNQVSKLSEKIKSYLPVKQLVVAVHNNKDFSLQWYYPGEPLALESDELYVGQPDFYRNFFLMTQKSDYLRLKEKGFNCVLQVPSPDDDGSLSVYRASKPYINVEAGYDQLEAQINMLRSI